MDLNKKIKSIEDNCMQLAQKDAQELEEKIEKISRDKLEEKVKKYKIELQEKFEREKNKIYREHNKSIFEYEKSQKMKMDRFKDSLVNNIKNKVTEKFYEFTNGYEYEQYLMRNIKNTIKNAKVDECNAKIFIVEKDYERFKDHIVQEFPYVIDKIENSYIGGCIVINEKEKIWIDNTIKNSIDEEIKKISF